MWKFSQTPAPEETDGRRNLSRHITLIRPPFISSMHSYSSTVTPPLSIAYLASSLLAAGYQVTAIDGLGEGINQIRIYDDILCRVRGLTIEEISNRIPLKTDIIGISAMFSQEWLFIRRILRSIKTRYPHIPIVLGGEHATALPEFILQTCPEVDLCALGEGEETIIDIARYFPGDCSKIPGVVYRDIHGRIIKTQSRPRLRAIDDIPRPAWHLFPMESYLSSIYSHGPHIGRTMLILATRGCPYQCTFCSNKSMWTQRYLMRSVKDVVDEIEEYKKTYRIEHIAFADLTAIIRKDWIMEFGQALKDRDINVSWSLPTGTRSESLDNDVLKMMAETNCRYIIYAAESGSPRILKSIKKQVNLDRLAHSMKQAKKNGLKIRCNLMLGFPQETRKDVLKTILFQMRLAWLGVDDATFTLFTPYPGSELFQYLRDKGKIAEINDGYFQSLLCLLDLTKSSGYCEHIGPRELAFYRLAGLMLFYSFYYLIRPSRIIRSCRNIFLAQKTETAFEQKMLEMLDTGRISKNKIRAETVSSHAGG